MHHSDFHQALQRYAQLQRIAFDQAQETARLTSGRADIRLTDIDAVALDAWRSSWLRPQALGYGGWDWTAIVAPLRRRPSAFRLAIWCGSQLCGLAVGRASKRRRSGIRHSLSVHYLESIPDPLHPLRGRIAAIALEGAEAYAAVLGAWRVRLIDPRPGVIRIYQRLGFGVASNSAMKLYLEKRIGDYGERSFQAAHGNS